MSLAVEQDVCLRDYNSMALPARAACFVRVQTLEQLREALHWAGARKLEILILGGGSNVLLASDFPGLVIRMELRGIEWLESVDGQPVVRVQAGECWHDFVSWTLEQGLSGLENLSLIPGTAGAAPVQNIGAYGVEVSDCIAQVQVLDRHTMETYGLLPRECRFAYRDSLFKQQPERWIILGVDFRLSRTFHPQLEYGPLRGWLEQKGITRPTALDVSRAVVAIRRSKLPDPALLANSGSFFKNPVISAQQALELQEKYPQLVSYPLEGGRVKLAAGWLIEQSGWKGYRQGDAGVHERQALVLVNYGMASGQQMLELAKRIQADIRARFSVLLEMEPVLVGQRLGGIRGDDA